MNPNHGLYLEVEQHAHDGCQWEPTKERGALVSDRHFRTTRAAVIVGTSSKGTRSLHGISYRLCAPCAALPRWNKGHRHTPIAEQA